MKVYCNAVDVLYFVFYTHKSTNENKYLTVNKELSYQLTCAHEVIGARSCNHGK